MKKKREIKPPETELDHQEGADSDEQATAAADSSPDSSGSDASKLREESDLLRKQIERAKADLANIRKRHRKELDEARGRAIEGFAMELLPVLDNFHLALGAHQSKETAATAEVQSMVEGLQMVRSLLEGALERHGLAEIPTVDKAFDPNLHEAIGLDPTSEAPAGHVAQVVQRGYQMEGRVLRASRVMVSGRSGEEAIDDRAMQGDGPPKDDEEEGD